jgi:hypothetical protein
VTPPRSAPERPRRGLAAERLSAQLLAGPPARDPLDVAERLLAIQGQDPRGARLAIRARSRGLRAADVDRALTGERSLLITWLNRGTLHLIRSEDYPLLQSLMTPQLRAASARRLAQEGLGVHDVERGVRVIADALSSDGPQTRLQLRDRLERADVPVAGQAFVHLAFRAAIEGLIVRGPMIGRQHAYALTGDWLPVRRPPDRHRGLAELARRYLRGHGPASDRDLARWAGLPLRDARAGLQAISAELRERDDGLIDLTRRDPAGELPPPRLLGAFEPVLLGWRDREPLVGAAGARVISGGIFRSFALVDGRVGALWKPGGAGPALEPLRRLPSRALVALERDHAAVTAFLD